MRLSKLQKLDPSAIGKCAMVFVPPLAIEKRRNLIEAFLKVLSSEIDPAEIRLIR
jgi:hypothetical protein